MDKKTIIIAIVIAVVNLGTIIVVMVTLWKMGKLMRENPPQEEAGQEQDDSWHSWRFWLPEKEFDRAKDDKADIGPSEPDVRKG